MQLHFKLNPSLTRVLAPGDRRLWLLRSVALRIEQQANPLWRFEIYHRRLLMALSLLAVIGWLLATSALYLWLDRQPHNQVGWFDLAAPWRWPGLRAKRGDTAVLAALDELKARDFTSAYYDLRVGLDRSPGNVEGRLMLARLVAGSEPARAVALVEEGLPFAGGNPKLISGLLAFYATFQIQSHGLEVVEGLLRAARPDPLPSETRRLLERARVGFLLQLGRYPEAEAAFAAIPPAQTPAEQAAAAALQVELLLRTGHAAEAKIVLDRNLAVPSVEPAVWRQAVEVAVAVGDADALLSALRHLKARAPEAPGVYLLAFQSWHRLKRWSYRDAAEQEYYQLFRHSDGALQALAALAVTLDLPDVVSRVQQVATGARLSPFAFQVHQTELALRRGAIEAATRLLRNWENNIDTLKTPQRFHPEFIKRLTRAAFAGTPDQVTFLLGHLTAARGLAAVPVYQLAGSVLEKSGNVTGAAEVVRAGLQVYPLSEPLLVAQRHLAEVAAATAVATAPAAIPADPTVRVLLLPVTAGEARQQLDELLQQDSLVAARNLARAIRTQKPAWLPLLERDLAAREVELAYLTLDQIASRTAARAYLGRYRNEADMLPLVAVVQRLAARNQLADARLLFDEINGAAPATVRVQQALRDLKLGDETTPDTGTQAAALAALDRSVLGQEWPQAERLLKLLHDKPPNWLAAAEAEVKVREVQVRLGLDQRPLALAAFKELVIKGGASRSAAFRLVRDLLARDESANALLLAREVSRLLPDDQAAARLVKEAEAPRPAGP
ncbi:hypothetical protein [Opitutus sp. GAS368]|uniref:hypothetical protein n=1 Tax=Opitutus sp. GAS368 TaxID=1882749 RepID=UPI00087D6326|nr:hypothetical protein [Opitutus sp. GAS368]SDS28781.1 hypothetical protein SAMN05444173_2434 [Opitutus sp. GAS368]